MKKVDYLMETKAEKELNNMTEFDITKGFEHLYVSNYCRLNACKVCSRVISRLFMLMSHTRIMKSNTRLNSKCNK